MKLRKFGILANKTTSLFTSIRDSKISRGWGKILEFPEGRGVIWQIPSVGGGWGMDIFWNHTIFAIPPLNTELEKAKKDLAALKEQAAGLTREYDRLLDEHSKAQVGNV